MLELEKFKEILGSEKEKMSEEEILELRENQDQMAEVFFSMWSKQLNKKKIS